MNRQRADRIVKAEAVKKQNTSDRDDARDCTDCERGGNAYAVRARRDSDESGETAVQRHGEIRFFEEDRACQHRRDNSRNRSERCCHQHIGDLFRVRAQNRAAVESEPSEPEQKYSDCRQRHAVPHDRHAVPVHKLADARPQKNHARKRTPAADTVNEGRSGEVVEVHFIQKAAAPAS